MTLSENGYVSMNPLDTATSSAGFDSVALELAASAFNTSSSAAENQRFRLVTEPEDNNTPTPSGRLSLLFGSGGASPTATGLSINADGTINFAAAQGFPGDGSSLTNLNASNLASGTVPSARLSGTYSINISGSASTATSLASNPADCAAGAFAQAIDASGTLTCSTNGSSLTSLSPANLSAGTAGINISGNAATATTASTATSATSFSGSLAGDVTGTQSATTVARLRSVNVSSTAPTSGQVLKFDGANWAPSADAGAGAVTGVTASSPLSSSGGTTPNITLPNVKIEPSNTAIGTSALLANTTGAFNTASGVQALQSNTTGNFNTANGFNALLNNTGNYNAASGAYALQNNTTGTYNTASGLSALVSNTTGSNNTAIGSSANVSAGNLTNATAIGANAVVDASNKIRLGNAAVIEVETAGYMKGLTGLCMGNDCKTTWPGSSQWTTSGSNIYYNTGNVGIGTSNPVHLLEVAGTLGGGNLANSTPRIAYGYNANASGGYGAMAVGYNATASGVVGIALGQSLAASGYNATAIGSFTTAGGDYSTAMGRNITVSGTGSFGIGLSSTPTTITAANTMAIMGGNVGIGTTSPGQKLDVAGYVKGQTGLCIGNDCKTTWPAGSVTGVTASTPLSSSGGATPNITLPNVKIEANNTAIGTSALYSNTTGYSNTASGADALPSNTTGYSNTASGAFALRDNSTGYQNTASGMGALFSNTTGYKNTAIGYTANVSAGNLTNATAIGAGAIVDASNKIRLGNSSVTVIEGQVAYTFTSDKSQKENFKPVDGEEVLKKVGDFNLTSWNYIGQDVKQFRHYGPMAQDFYAAFGNDGVGTIGTPTTINSGDMAGILMIAVQALEKQNREIKTENAGLNARLEALEQLVRGRPYLTAATAPVQ